MCELEFIDLPSDPDGKWCDLGKGSAGFNGRILLDGRDITERPAPPSIGIELRVPDGVPPGVHLVTAKPTWEEMRANLITITVEDDHLWRQPDPVIVSQHEYDELRAEHR